MKNIHACLDFLAVPGILVLLAAAGCSGKDGDRDADTGETTDDGGGEADVAADPDGDPGPDPDAAEDALHDEGAEADTDAAEDAEEEQETVERIAAEKFIPTFTVKYCGPDGARSTEETAKFDLLVTNAGFDDLWSEGGLNSWRSLKVRNPDMTITFYKLGPGEYNTATWGDLGDGWVWMTANHGDGAADRWTARGVTYGTYLQSEAYENERLMIVGSDGWQHYWVETIHAEWWGGGLGIDCDGGDGIFSDNTTFQVPWEGQWYREGHPDQPDDPEEYFEAGEYLSDLWRQDMAGLFAWALPWLADRGVVFVPNFGYMATHAEYWDEIDALPVPPFAAMEEAGFVCPYGVEGSYNVWNWQDKVDVMLSLAGTRALMTNHGQPDSELEGLDRMGVADGAGMTGWDALWFSMTSFLMGFDDVRGNAYMNFTIWGYCTYFWIDEFDPAFLHLGRARGGYVRDGDVALREFDDGWAAVNPSLDDATGIAVPSGQARIVDHSNFMDPGASPLVTSFDLPARRGVVLLKDGRLIGNGDN